MTQAAVVGDVIGHGTPEGNIITGSPDAITDNMQRARVGDLVYCNHDDGDGPHGIQVIITGSGDTFGNGIGYARVGDVISCGATILSGSSDLTVDG